MSGNVHTGLTVSEVYMYRWVLVLRGGGGGVEFSLLLHAKETGISFSGMGHWS